jgi:hypothetical protein
VPAHPVLDVKAAQQITGRSHVAVGKALARLEQAGILSRLNARNWRRVWECPALFDLMTDFERAIAPGLGDASGNRTAPSRQGRSS